MGGETPKMGGDNEKRERGKKGLFKKRKKRNRE